MTRYPRNLVLVRNSKTHTHTRKHTDTSDVLGAGGKGDSLRHVAGGGGPDAGQIRVALDAQPDRVESATDLKRTNLQMCVSCGSVIVCLFEYGNEPHWRDHNKRRSQVNGNIERAAGGDQGRTCVSDSSLSQYSLPSAPPPDDVVPSSASDGGARNLTSGVGRTMSRIRSQAALWIEALLEG